MDFTLRDVFDVPDLATTNDDIVNGYGFRPRRRRRPAGALHRAAGRLFAGAAAHYTATDARAFPEPRAVHQLPVLRRGVRGLRPRRCWPIPTAATPLSSDPAMSRSPTPDGAAARAAAKLPQMPTYHLKRDGHGRHHAGQHRRRPVERQDRHRPHRGAAPACLADGRPLRRPAQHAAAGRFRAGPRLSARGPCARRRPAGLGADPGAGRDPDRAGTRRWPRSPSWKGYELKRIMRTGTVATIDNRNWELRDQSGPVQRLSPVPRHRAGHGKRHDRRQRLPLPGALRHAAVRLRQAAARRTEAARHGHRTSTRPRWRAIC